MNKLHLRPLLIVLAILFSLTGNATIIVPTKSTLHKVGGLSVGIGATTGISAPSDGATYTDLSQKGIITLAVDHHYPFILAESHTQVELSVTTYNTVGGSPNTPFTIVLEVDYTPGTTLAFNDRQLHQLDGILAFDIEVTDIVSTGAYADSLPANLYIDAELFIDRAYDFSNFLDESVELDDIDETKIFDNNCDEVMDALLVRWDKIKEAEEYQVEWTYVNDYTEEEDVYKDIEDVSYDFRFNSSRISTADNEYYIPLTYDHGYVVYRVRAIGRYMPDPTKRQYSLWTIPQSGSVDSDSDEDFYHIEEPWEISKNWQYSVTFAEEGKRKEVVSFFDGSLRNRQMVTLISTNQKAIVGETIYDYQGRPAIQVLPTPVAQPDCHEGHNTLKYYPDFNRNLSDVAYSKTDFDLSDSEDSCSAVHVGMSPNYGASNYYSSSNPETTGAQGYLPNALNFPFSQVEYMPDNTGRIRRQGGVGETFQLDSDHESHYFYGHPSQIELDRLFGSEVGYAKHYQKNMVVDPNGQISVSYLDQEGRVIATALAGAVPDNLIALESWEDASVTLTDNILNENNSESNELSEDGLSLTVNETILVSSSANMTIDYNQEIEKFTDECLAENICFGCTYELTIDLKDLCGVSMLPEGTLQTLTGHFSLSEIGDTVLFSMDCEEDELMNLPYTATIEGLNPGSYQLTKVLRLSEDAIDFYQQQFLDSNINTCFKTLEDFQEEYLAAADFSGCIPDTTCEQCLESMPSLEDFLGERLGTENDYALLLSHCDALCKPISMYETYRNFLAMDMNPGGQYGEYLLADGTFLPEQYPLSVYNADNKLPRSYYPGALTSDYDWQHPVIKEGGPVYGYFEEDMLTESKIPVEVTKNSTNEIIAVSPNVMDTTYIYLDLDLGYYTVAENLQNADDFIANFRPSWAYSLVYYHPEYHLLKTYYQLTLEDANDISSESFDDLMQRTNTWEEAVDAGFIDGYALEDFSDDDPLHAYDPFLVDIDDPVLWSDYKDLLLDKVYTSYATISSTDYTMAEIAAMTARCGMDLSPGSDCFGFGNDALTPTTGGTTPADTLARNADWVNFKNFYRSLKQNYIAELSIKRSIETDTNYYGYNGCIGTSNFNPFARGFFNLPSGTQYINTEQPCYVDNAILYAHKVKRFMLPSEATASGEGGYTYALDPETLSDDLDAALLLNTGQCPLSVGLGALSNDLASGMHLTESAYALPASAGTIAFINSYFGITNPPTALPDLTWNATITNDSTLTVTVDDDSPATIVNIEFRLYEDTLIEWDSIQSIVAFQSAGTGGLGFKFTAKALYTHGDTTDVYPLFGSTDLDIFNCTLPDDCVRNEMGDDVFDLFNVLIGTGHLSSTSYYLIKGTGANDTIESFVTDRLAQALSGTSTPAPDVNWKFATPGRFFLSVPGATAPGVRTVEFTVTGVSAGLMSVFGSITGFSEMIITGPNTFRLICVDVDGEVLGTIDFEADIQLDRVHVADLELGSCAPPTTGCDDLAVTNYNELQALLEDVLMNQSPTYDLFASDFMTDNLASQITGSGSSTGTVATLVYSDGLSITPMTFDHQTVQTIGSDVITETYYQEITSGYVIVYEDSVVCGPGETGEECDSTRFTRSNLRSFVKINETTFDLFEECTMVLKLKEAPLTSYSLADVTDVISFEVTGETDLHGNYHEFMIVVELDGTDQDTIFGEICLPIRPCTDITTPFTTGPPFPEVVITDPCAAFVTNFALSAAEEAYNDYVDSLLTDFRGRYVEHCMSTLEEFSRTYDQREHHFTLYYYDQAGNLVKTVPPEGVEQLDITSNLDDLAQDIAQDRANNVQNVITNHRMATMYEYNSLNQLIAQRMPDQENVTTWNQTKANGLDADLQTTGIQMLDASIGYLTGYVTNSANSPTGSRGYLYQTVNGGSNWTRVNVLQQDLLRVKMADEDVGFAVGKWGTVFRTRDGGTTWDLLDMHSIGVVGDFVDVAFEDTANVAFLMANGHVVSYSSSVLGSEYTPANPTIPSGSSSVTLRAGNSIAYNGSSDEYTVNLEFVTGTSPDTVRFTQLAVVDLSSPSTTYQEINGTTWNAISYSSSDFGVISGINGDLVFLDEVNTAGRGTQVLQSTSSIFNVLEAYFIDRKIGVALLNSETENYFSFTDDAGETWTQVSETTVTCITLVSRTSTELYVAVSYSDGDVVYYEVSSSGASMIWTNPTGPFDRMTSCDDGGGNYFILGTESGGTRLFKSGGFVQNPMSTPSFSTHYTYASGTLPTQLKAIWESTTLHVIGIRTISSTPVVEDVYKIGAGTATAVTISPSSTDFKALVIGHNGADYLLAYEDNNQKIHRMALGTGAPSSGSLAAISASSSLLPGGCLIAAMDLHSDFVTLVGSKGEIYSSTTTVSNSSTTNLDWEDRNDLRIQPVHSISTIDFPYTSPTHEAVAVGNFGTVLDRTNADLWTVEPLEITSIADIATNLNAVATTTISSVPYAFIVGNGGVKRRWNLNTGDITAMSVTGSPFFVQDVSDISVNASDVGIFTSYSGKSFYCSSITAGTPTFTSTNVSSSLNGICLIPGSNSAVAVGNNGLIWNINSSTITPINAIFGPKLNSVHFEHELGYGTVVGDNFFVRYTLDNASFWSRILPATVNSTTLTKDVTDVWTRVTADDNHFSILGGNSYLASCLNEVATPNSTFAALSLPVHDIRFSTNNLDSGFVAAGTYLKSIRLTSTGTSYTYTLTNELAAALSTDINAIAILDLNGTTDEVMVVGDNMIRYKAAGATTTISLLGGVTGNVRDVAFTDATHGYVAGDNGLFYQTDVITFNTAGTAYTAMSWTQRDISDDATTILSDINVTAIEFPTAMHGVWGGYFEEDPASGYAAARILGVEDQLYSARFFYDRLGRIVVSQNARQEEQHKFSYTLYDELGRVYEAGEKTENTFGLGIPRFPSIFGTNVGGQYVTSVIDDEKLQDWITTQSNTSRKEVTKSYYDDVNASIDGNGLSYYYAFNTATQRKRIVHVTYEEVYDSNDATYDHATHYDYDIHGNVKTLIQDNKKQSLLYGMSAERFKQMDYVYDLISGNVHRVDYETGKTDQWHHAYRYDADNRITEVYTTSTTPLTDPAFGKLGVMVEPGVSPYWAREAEYQYYDHGPLARTVIGEHEVQGLDYVYTLQGWIKSVNSNTLNVETDPGQDAYRLGANHAVAMDVMSYSLHYYLGDYQRVNTSNLNPIAGENGEMIETSMISLYNGNIGSMVTTITHPDTREILPLGNKYSYDQLNRLKVSQSQIGLDLSGDEKGWNGTTVSDMYTNAFTYDANGNIETQYRRDENGDMIDNLVYNYHTLSDGKKVRNRLYSVNDEIPDANYADDIDDMDAFTNSGDINVNNNYSYDSEGRLIKDAQEEIAQIIWRVDGKVKKIVRTEESEKKNVSFDYDPMGHRIAKHIYTSEDVLEKSTYYILDAQGNTMSTYDRVIDNEEMEVTYVQKEKHIYGSSRLGVVNTYQEMEQSESIVYPEDGALQAESVETVSLGSLCTSTGKWYYEVYGTSGSASAGELTFTDNTPSFGAMSSQFIANVIPGETYTLSFDLTDTVNLSSLDFYLLNCSGGYFGSAGVPDYGHYNYDFTIPADAPSIVRIKWLAWETADDDMGFTLANIYISGPGIQFSTSISSFNDYSQRLVIDSIGTKQYELTNHLGNVLSVVSDKVLSHDNGSGGVDYFLADIRQATDYSPFGVQLSGRNLALTGTSDNYRFAFNGMEGDPEIKGEGNSYTTEFRQYDPRLGRWLSLDPLMKDYPDMSPFCAFANNPIVFNDPKGLAPEGGPGKPTALAGAAKVLAGAAGGKTPAKKPASKPAASKSSSDKSYTGGIKKDAKATAQALKDSGSPLVAGLYEINAGLGMAVIQTAELYNPQTYIDAQQKVVSEGMQAAAYAQESGVSAPVAVLAVAMKNNADAVANYDLMDWSQVISTRIVAVVAIYYGASALSTIGESVSTAGEVTGVVEDAGVAAETTSSTFRSFTSSNFRTNLGRLTGEVPEGSQAHHVFPQKYEAFFNRAGINIHDPKFGAWWESSGHLKNASGYNTNWGEFIRLNPNATQSQILNQGRIIMQKYGLSTGF